MATDRDLQLGDNILRTLKEKIYVKDYLGNIMPYRTIIQFSNATIVDDPDNDRLIITIDTQ